MTPTNIIARREIRATLPSGTECLVGVALALPTQTADSEWSCEFRIEGLPAEIRETAFGIDGIQALLMALEGIRVRLAEATHVATWVGGEEGDMGFPAHVPTYFGVAFARGIERMIEERVRQFAQDAAELASARDVEEP